MQPVDESLDEATDSSLESSGAQVVRGGIARSIKLPSIRLAIAVIIFFALTGLGSVLLLGLHANKQPASQGDNNGVSNFAVGNLQTNGVTAAQSLSIGQANHLTINGQLQVTSSLVLNPSGQPTTPVAGQIYFDQSTKVPYYFNGTAFVSLQPNAIPQAVTALGGVSGSISLGSSLSISGNQLNLSGSALQELNSGGLGGPKVTSLQGLTGDLTLTGGSGIDVTGTTISNTGVVGLTSSDGSVLISNNGNGSFDLQVVNGGSGNTAILLGPPAVQSDNSTNSSVHINKVAAGDFLELASNNVDKFVVDQSGDITVGTIGYSQVQGAPATTVTNIGGVSGAITVGSGLNIAGSTLSNSGVVSVTGTANQVIVSGATGNVTFSLPQSINTSSSPTFSSETLTNNLAVHGGGLTVGVAGTVAGILTLANSTNSNLSNLNASAPSGSGTATYTLPSIAGGSSANICLDTGNCAGTGGGITGAGSANTLALFTGAGTIGNSVLTQSGGNLIDSGALTVQSGGINITGNSTISGTLSGLTGLSSSGIITFTGLNTAGVVHTDGTGKLTTSSVVLGTDTSGNYVASIGSVTGLTVGGTNGVSGAVPTLTVNYGSSANTAVQGNTSLTCASGTGNLSGGGNSITLGAGGSCNGITITNSPTFSGNLTVQGASGVTIGSTTNTGVLSFLDGTNDGFTGTIELTGALANNQTYLLPATGGTICLDTGNCSSGATGAAGGDLTGTYPNPTIAKLQGHTLTISSPNTGDLLLYNGSAFVNQAVSGDVTINGSGVTTIGAGKVTNADLQNSGITINNGTNISGGSSISLGGNITVSVINNPSFSGLVSANGGLSVANATTLTNAGATLNSAVSLGNFATGGAIGTAAATVDSATSFTISQTTAGQTLTIPNPTTTTAGRVIYILNTGTQSFNIAGVTMDPGTNSSFIWNGSNWTSSAVSTSVSLIGALDGGTANANGASISGNSLYLQSASASFPGVVNTVAQTFSGDKTFSGNLTVQGATGLTVGAAGSVTGLLNLTTSANTNVGTLQIASLGQNTTYTLPDPGASGATICLSTGNCAGAGGGITGSGTSGDLAVFNGSGSITNSATLSESGSTLTDSGSLVIQGANTLSLGTASSHTGSIAFSNSTNGNTVTLQSGASGSNFTLTLPTTHGNNGDCLESNGAGVLSFASCTGGAGGGVTSLDSQTGVLSLSNSSGSGGVITIDNAKADGATEGIATFNSTNFSDNGSGVINTVQNINSTATPTFGGLTLNGALDVASGTVTFGSLNSAGVVHTDGSGKLSTGSVVLGTDTTGNYVASIGSVTGLSVGGTNGTSGAIPTLSVLYGSSASTAVQGSVTFTCPSSGTNLSGGGNTITEGTGGTCNSLSVVNNPAFSGLVSANGGLSVATGSTFTNASSTLLTALAIANLPTGGAIGTAAATVDVATTFDVSQTTAGQALSLPSPTVATSGRIVYVDNVGSTSFTMAGNTIPNGQGASFIWNGSAWKTINNPIAGTGLTQSGNTINSAAATSVVNDTNIQGSISGNALTLSWAGTLSATRGGTGVNGATAANGALLIGNGSGYSLATLTAGAGINITNGSGTITIASSGATGSAGGDLTGTYPNPTIAKLQGNTLTISSPSTGDLLMYNGSAFVNQTVSGDVTINGSGVTAIGAGKVTNTDLQNSSITINNGTNVTGGAAVSLGGNLTIGVVNNPTFSGLITANGGISVATGTTLTNAGSTLNTAVSIANLPTGGAIGTAGATVDGATTFNVNQTTAGQTLSLPSPTVTTAGRIIYIDNIGSTSFIMGGNTIPSGQGASYIWNGTAWTVVNNAVAGTGLTQSGNTINSAAATSVVNDTNIQGSISGNALTLAWAGTLSVARGGTGAGTFTTNGVLYGNGTGALQATAAGTGGQVLLANGSAVPTFTTVSGDVTINSTGVTAIGAGKVTNADLQNSSLTVTPGTNLTGGGSVSLGGSVTLNVSNSPTFSGNLTVQGSSGVTVGSTTNNGLVTFLDGTNDGFTGTVELAGAIGSNQTYSLPTTGGTICVSTGNCSTSGSAGGDLTGTYPNPTIAKLQGHTLTISSPTSGDLLLYNGSAFVNQAVTGDITINGSGVTAIGAGKVTNTDLQNSSITVTASTGLSGGGAVSLGGSTSLSVAYGSSAGTAVQGNTTLTCASGTGNLSGGGNVITLGSGGTCNGITIVNNPTFSGLITANGGLSIANATTFTNSGATLNPAVSLSDFPTGGPIGTAAATVDSATSFAIAQTTAGQTLSIPSPTSSAAGRVIYILNTGTASFIIGGVTMGAGTNSSFIWNGSNWTSAAVSTAVSLVGSLNGGTANANGATISGNTIYLQSASNSNAGLIDTAAQTFAGNKTFNGSLTVANASGVTLGSASNAGLLSFLDGTGDGFTVGIQTATQANNVTLTIPADTHTTDQICLKTLANCAGSGGGITGSGTSGDFTIFNGSSSVTNSSNLSESGSVVTDSGTLLIQGASSLTLGTASGNTGGIVFNNSSNGNTVTLQAGASGSNFTLTLPTTHGNNGDCLESNGSGGLSFASCTGGSGGGVTSLDSQTGVLSLSNSSGSGGVITINNAKADGSTEGIATFSATNFSDNGSGVINTIQNINSTATPTFGGLTLSTGNTFTNASSTLLTALSISNLATGGNIGTAAATVDVATSFNVNQTTAGQTLSLPSPTVTTAGRIVYVNNVGSTSFLMGGNTIPNAQGGEFEWNGTAWTTINNPVAGTGLSQSGNTINSAAATSVVNDTNIQGSISSNVLTLAWAGTLSVARGGTGAGSFTTNGVLYGNGTGALQATSAGTSGQVLLANGSGIPTFTTLSGDVTVSGTGATTIGAGKVTNADLANSSLTVTAGTNLTGGGSVSLGGSVTLNVSSSPTFSGNLTVQGSSGVTVGSTTNNGVVSFLDGTSDGFTASVDLVGALSSNQTYNLPTTGGTFCLSINNCTATGTAGGDLTGSYPNPTIAKLQGHTLTISSLAGGDLLLYNGSAFVNQAVTGDVTINSSGVTAIGAGKVTNTDLQNSSVTVTAGTGLTGGGAVALGSSTTLNVAYGSTSGTAVQGNTTLTCPSGTGNLSGGGNVITLGAGGSCSGITIVNGPTFSGNLTVQGSAGVTIGSTTNNGVLSFLDGTNDGFTGTIKLSGAIGANQTYNLPTTGGTICIDSSSACGFTTGSGAAFVNGGNNFGGNATLGTTGGGQSLIIETAGSTRGTFDTSGNFNLASGAYQIGGANILTNAGLTFASAASTIGFGASASTANGLTIQGQTATGATANGGALTINGGQTNASNTANGGNVAIQGGTDNSTNGGAGGNVTIEGGASTNGVGGSVRIGTTSSSSGVTLGINNALVVGNNSSGAVSVNTSLSVVGSIAGNVALSVAGSSQPLVSGNGSNASNIISTSAGIGGGTSGTTGQTAGNGGGINLTTGAGGAATGASGANTAGNGGGFTIQGGVGGNVTSATGTAGSGGAISIQGGAPGTGGSTAGKYGNVILQASGGNVGIGTSGTPSTLLSVGGTVGNFTVDGSGNINTVGNEYIKSGGELIIGVGNNPYNTTSLIQSYFSGVGDLALGENSSGTADLLDLYDFHGISEGSINPSGKLTLGTLATSGTVYQGQLAFSDGTTDNRSVTLQLSTQSVGSATLSVPDLAGTNSTICIQLSSACGFTTGSGVAFVNGGNNFGGNATLGTTGVGQSLIIETAGSTRGTFDTSGNFNLASGAYQIGGANILTSSGLTFTAASANSITGTNNQNLTIGSQGSGQLTLNSASSGLALQSAGSTVATITSGNLGFASANTTIGFAASASTANSFTLQGQTATGATATGGTVNINGGQTNGSGIANGGNVVIQGGLDNSGSGGVGGNVNIDAGNSTNGVAGSINIGSSGLAETVNIGYASASHTINLSGATNLSNIGGSGVNVLTINGTSWSTSTAGNGFANGALINTSGGLGETTTATNGKTGGTGSFINLVAGQGGAATGASGNNVGGAGGSFTIAGGAGGNVTSATGTSGSGGSITIQGGLAGTGGGTSGAIGNILLQSSGGYVGIGTASPSALLSVGSGSPFQVNSAGNVTLATVAAASSNTYLCLNGSQIAACNTTGTTTGAAFIQGGNNFGATTVATLGTNASDNGALQIQTDGLTRATFDTSGNLNLASGGQFQVNSGTTLNATNLNFTGAGTIQSGSGTQLTLNSASSGLALQAGGTTQLVLNTGTATYQQAETVSIASAASGTQLTVQGGAATSGTNVGGNLLLQGGAGASTGASGSVVVQSNGNNSTTAFQVQNAGTASVLSVGTVPIPVVTTAPITQWTNSPSSLPQQITGVASTTYNGYIYSIGGTTGAANTNKVYYAKINPNGSIGPWNVSGNNLPQQLDFGSAVVANGWLYYIGGQTFAGTVQSTVYVAQINSDGSIGSWTSTTGLTSATSQGSAVSLGGYIYYIGGENTSFATQTSAVVAQPNAGTGLITSWGSTTSLPLARDDGNALVNNGYVYWVGGWSGSANVTTVYYATISGGAIGTWNTTTALPSSGAGLASGAAVINNGFIYQMGGIDSSSTFQQSSEYALINSNGTIGSWITTNQVPEEWGGIGQSGAVTNGNYIYLLGGYYSGTYAGYSEDVFIGQVNGSQTVPGLGTATLSGNLNVTGATLLQNTVNSTTDFQIQNAAGSGLFTADTSNMQVNVAGLYAPNTVTLTLSPGAPTVSPQNTGGTTTYTYEITAVSNYGAESYASQTGTTALGNATLSSTNYNKITYAAPTGGANYYRIYRTVGGVNQGFIGTATGTTFNDTGLVASSTIPALSSTGSLSSSTAYYYEVTALDNTGGQTTASSEVTVTTPANRKTITVSWSPVPGARAYNVYRGTSSGGENIYFTTPTNSYVDTGTGGIAGSPPTTSSAYANNLSNNANVTLTVGSQGTANQQLYVGGQTPTAPVASINTDSEPYGMAVVGNYTYLVTNNTTSGTLEIFNTAVPSKPSLISDTVISHGASNKGAEAIVVAGNIAYITNTYADTLTIYNVSNPQAPTLMSTTSTGSDNNDIGDNLWLALQGRYLYVLSDWQSKILVYDVSNPNAPVLAGSAAVGNGYDGANHVRGMAIYNGYLYEADHIANTISVYSLANPTSPSFVSSIATTSHPGYLTVTNNYMYVTFDANGTFGIYDVSNPATPSLVSMTSMDSSDHPEYVVVQGNIAYIALEQSYQIEVMDITNPSDPIQLGAMLTNINPVVITSQGNYLYVNAYTGSQLQIYDVGGAYLQQLQAGAIQTNSLEAQGEAYFNQDATVAGALTVGSAAQFNGNVGVSGSLSLQNTSNSNNALQVSNASGLGLFNVNTSSGLIGFTSLTAPASPSATAASGGSLAASLTYYFEVTAIDGSGGESGPSTEVNASTSATCTASGNCKINVAWTAVPGAASYRIYYGTASNTETAYYTSGTNSFTLTTAAGTAGTPPSLSSAYADRFTNTGAATFQTLSNSSTAFQFQNAAGNNIVNVDTTNSGALTVAGVAPASIGAGSGTAASTILTVTGPAGGASSATTGVSGGVGAAISLTSGTGGAVTGASGTNTAGAGGAISIQGGNGGSATSGVGGAGASITLTAGNGGASTGTNVNANGGNIILVAGSAGSGGSGTAGTIGSVIVKNTSNSTNAFQVQNTTSNNILNVDTTNSGALTVAGVAPTLVSSGNGTAASTILTVTGPAGGASSATTNVTGGIGSAISLTSGNGGAVTGASGTNTAGAGGNISIQGGNGGSATSGVGGAGASLTFTAGNGGTSTGTNVNANGGNITLVAGSAGSGGSGTAGTIGSVIIKNASNSSIAFQVQNTSNADILNADTANNIVTVNTTASGGTFINNGSTLNTAKALSNFNYSGSGNSGTFGTAASTVDIYTSFTVNQTTSGQTLVLASPTNATAGRIIYIANIGTQAFTISGNVIGSGTNASFLWNGSSWTATAVSTGVSVIGTIDTAGPSSNGATISGNTIYLQSASATNPGLVNTSGTGQTFAGPKSFQATNTSAFQIQTTSGTSTLFTADTSNMRIDVGTNGTATGQLYVSGSVPSSALATYNNFTGIAAVATQGNYAYVADNSGNALDIVDITKPASPVQVGSVSISSPFRVYVRGRYAYVTGNGSSGALYIVDISNPASPTVVGTSAQLGGSTFTYQAIYVQGRYAYVANAASNVVYSLDISNPASPIILNSVSINDPEAIAGQGNYLYITDTSDGRLYPVNVTNPNVMAVGNYVSITGSNAEGVVVQGRYAYVTAAGTNTVNVIDISNPNAASVVTTVATDSTPVSISLQGRYIYVFATVAQKVDVIDVSNPASPASVGSFSGGGSSMLHNASALAVQGRYAYLSDTANLQTYDLGGEYAQQFQAGGIETGSLQVDGSSNVIGNESVQGGLNVSGSSLLAGNVGVGGTLLLQPSTNSSTAFQIEDSAGNLITNVSTATGQATFTSTNTAFPTTPVLDNFNGLTNGTTPPDANWNNSSTPAWGDPNNLKVSSNAVTSNSSTTGSDAWTTPLTSSSAEVYVTINTLHASGGGETVDFLSSPTSSTPNGYGLLEAGNNALSIFKISGSSSGTTIGSTISQTISAGDSIGLRLVRSGSNDILTMWYKPSGGSWTQLETVTDSSSAFNINGYYMAMEAGDSTVLLDNFGGGNDTTLEGNALTANGTELIQTTGNNSTSAFQVQGSSGTAYLTVDTVDGRTGLGVTAATLSSTAGELQVAATSDNVAIFNATGTSNDIVDAQNNGTTYFKVANSGALTITQTVVASVSSGNGTAAVNAVAITGQAGGATTDATSTAHTGGQGSGVTIQGGNGGAAASGTNATGGAGGSITITAGNGGNGATTGGAGGNITLQAGTTGTGGTPALGLVIIGSGTTGTTTPSVLVLDNKNNAGDPTVCSKGGLYYNSNTNKFRACLNGNWVNMISAQSVNCYVPAAVSFGSCTAAASSSWSVPNGASAVEVIAVGGGGGGGGGTAGATATARTGGGGGGGGAYSSAFYSAADFSASITVTPGTAGTAGAANGSGGSGSASTFGTNLTAGGGARGTTAALGGGGGGTAASSANQTGGAPAGGAAGASVAAGGGGGGGASAGNGGDAEYGGGGGSGGSSGAATPSIGGGSSLHGGGGGGGGAGCTTSNTVQAGSPGGASNTYTGGTGGAYTAGAIGGSPSNGSSITAGAGGGGGGNTATICATSGTAFAGGTGAVPGGGGGGGGAALTGGAAAGGAGGAGAVWVIAW